MLRFLSISTSLSAVSGENTDALAFPTCEADTLGGYAFEKKLTSGISFRRITLLWMFFLSKYMVTNKKHGLEDLDQDSLKAFLV